MKSDIFLLTMKAPETVCSTKTLEILAFPLNHKIETYGFFFREKMPLMNVRKEKIAEYGLTPDRDRQHQAWRRRGP